MITFKIILPAMIAYFLIHGLPLEGQPSAGEFRRIREEIRINEEQERYDENLELIRKAHGRGYFFLIHPGLPQWEPYKDLEGFAGISEKDLELRNRAMEGSRTICEVDLPVGFDPGRQWPLCLIFHGGGSNMERVREHWHSGKLDEGYIKVWFRSYRHYDWDTYGWRSGDRRAHREVDSLFRELLHSYPVDTSHILAAGISAGGTFAFDLAFRGVIPLTGILAFCPGIPEGLNAQTQENQAVPGMRAYIVGGENDYYLPGQKQLAGHLDSWGLQNCHIIVPGMGHAYPGNEAGYIDRGIEFLTGDTILELFAPAILPDTMATRDMTLSNDNGEMYFTVISGNPGRASIYYTKKEGSTWTVPEETEFAADPAWMFYEPCLNADGSRLYFTSDMPLKDPEGASGTNIWYVIREGNSWGMPLALDSVINSTWDEYFPSLTKDGTLYFTRGSATGEYFIYRSRPESGQYRQVEKLPDEVNLGRNRFNAFIARDESYMILPIEGMDGSCEGMDYHLIPRDPDDRWGKAINLGTPINSGNNREYSASVSPDEKYLFFMSGRQLPGEEEEVYRSRIFRVDFATVARLMPPDHLTTRELNSCIRQLPGDSPLLYRDELLHSLFDWGSAGVVGLGEATHGTREFFELKHRLFRYLVENHDFRALAYEFSYRKSLAINEYVLTGKGDVDSLLAGESWIQENRQVKELIRWMKLHNAGKSAAKQIHFIGIDNQLDAVRPSETLEILCMNSPGFRQANLSLVRRIANLDLPVAHRYRNMQKSEFDSRDSLYLLLHERAAEYFHKDQGTEKEALPALHLSQNLLRSHRWLFAVYHGKQNVRDLHMAENVLWTCNYLGEKTGIAVWAHNAHVACNPHYQADGGASMGKYLRDRLGDRYLVLNTSFSQGQFKAVLIGPDGKDTPPMDCEIRKLPPAGSVNAVFNSAKYGNFFLNLKAIPRDGPLYSYLDTLRPMIGVGDAYAGEPELHFTGDRILNLTEASDLLFYFKKTHPADF